MTVVVIMTMVAIRIIVIVKVIAIVTPILLIIRTIAKLPRICFCSYIRERRTERKGETRKSEESEEERRTRKVVITGLLKGSSLMERTLPQRLMQLDRAVKEAKQRKQRSRDYRYLLIYASASRFFFSLPFFLLSDSLCLSVSLSLLNTLSLCLTLSLSPSQSLSSFSLLSVFASACFSRCLYKGLLICGLFYHSLPFLPPFPILSHSLSFPLSKHTHTHVNYTTERRFQVLCIFYTENTK